MLEVFFLIKRAFYPIKQNASIKVILNRMDPKGREGTAAVCKTINSVCMGQ
jgi:hypothetical protein